MSNNTPKTRTGLWSDGLGWASIRSAQVLLVLSLVAVATFVLSQVTLVVIPVLLALILTAAIAPAVKWMVAKGMSHVLATALSFVALILVFGGVVTGIVFAVKNEWAALVTSATDGFNKLYGWVKESSPVEINDDLIHEGQDKVVSFLSSSNFSNGAINSLGAVGNFGTGFVLMAVILFYFLKDGAKIWDFILSWLSGERKQKAELAGTRAMEVLGGYIRGTAAVAGVDAVFIGAALFIAHVPLALPLAVLTFVGGFIPLVGATAAGAFAVLIALVSNGPITALVVLIVVIGVNQLEGNFLQPVLMGNALKVHALVILIALTVGTIQAGIVGAVLSVPLVAVLWAIIKVWTGKDSTLHTPEASQDPQDAVSTSSVAVTGSFASEAGEGVEQSPEASPLTDPEAVPPVQTGVQEEVVTTDTSPEKKTPVTHQVHNNPMTGKPRRKRKR
ncbi:MAG: AI-2E family transporter [Enterococcus sp.]|nr:AI-2E family transporter [Enterococcus sp.]